jgi:hypothetical protein
MSINTLDDLDAALGAISDPSPPSKINGARPKADASIFDTDRPAVFGTGSDLPDMASAAQTHGPFFSSWNTTKFYLLSSADKTALLSHIYEHEAFKLLAGSAYPVWRDIVWSFCHAALLGAFDAKEFARLWSQSAPNRFEDTTFDRVWNSYREGVTVEKLWAEARKSGFDVEAAIDKYFPAVVHVAGLVPTAITPAVSTATFFMPVKSGQQHLVAPQWIAPSLLLRNAISVLVGTGGSLKTTLTLTILVAIAAGRSRVGPFAINQKPGGLKAAVISAEEDERAIARLVAAACIVLKLTPAEKHLVDQNLLLHDATTFGWRLGEPPLNSRDAVASENQDTAAASLKAALDQHRPDILMIDTMSATFALPSENDNGAITRLMNRLRRIAAGIAILIVHHTPKMTRESLAQQRGEQTASRGGGAVFNSARIGLTLTHLPADEAGQLAAMGSFKPEFVRRLEHSKINDAAPMDPAYIRSLDVQIQVRDGTTHAIRAVEFITRPTPGSAGSTTVAYRNLAMKVIDAGCRDAHGARVPLSMGAGARNARDAVKHVAGALMSAQPGLVEAHARSAAKAVIGEMLRMGCLREIDVAVSQYKADGKPNGMKQRRGLVTDWALAPWTAHPADPAPAPDPSAAPAPPAHELAP